MCYLILFWSLLLKSVSCFDCAKYVPINYEDIFHHFWLLPRHLLGFYPHTFSFTGSYWSGSFTMHSISNDFLNGYMWCYLFFNSLHMLFDWKMLHLTVFIVPFHPKENLTLMNRHDLFFTPFIFSRMGYFYSAHLPFQILMSPACTFAICL